MRRFMEMAVEWWRGHLAVGEMGIQDQAQGRVNGQGEAEAGGRGIVRDKSGKMKEIGGHGCQAVMSTPN